MKVIKLFWIDDSENWAKSAQDNLKLICNKYGVTLQIVAAVNGEEILNQCMMYDFDAIIMDYNMDPFFGDKYISDVRNEEHLESIPILFYSQDNSVDLSSLIGDAKNVECIFRPNLEDKIKELFFIH